ncbi:hypothetical protein EV426DRAFT_578910 [Tirmania nivea]|nr:hypothetical protein EV426DRAFT_578910 [Tirmania nivea]
MSHLVYRTSDSSLAGTASRRESDSSLHARISSYSTGSTTSSRVGNTEHNDNRFLTVPTWKHIRRERRRKMLGKSRRKSLMKKALAERDLLYQPDSSMKTNEECQAGAITVESIVNSISDTPNNITDTANNSTQFSAGISAFLLLELPLIEIRPATPNMFEARGLLRDGQDRDICSKIDALRLQQLVVRQNTRLLRLGLNQLLTSLADPGTVAADTIYVDTKPCSVKELLDKVQEEWASLVKETRRIEMSVKASILSRGISGQLQECHRAWIMSRLSLHQVEMVELQEELYTLQQGVESVVPEKWFSMPKWGLVTEKVRDLLHWK